MDRYKNLRNSIRTEYRAVLWIEEREREIIHLGLNLYGLEQRRSVADVPEKECRNFFLIFSFALIQETVRFLSVGIRD